MDLCSKALIIIASLFQLRSGHITMAFRLSGFIVRNVYSKIFRVVLSNRIFPVNALLKDNKLKILLGWTGSRSPSCTAVRPLHLPRVVFPDNFHNTFSQSRPRQGAPDCATWGPSINDEMVLDEGNIIGAFIYQKNGTLVRWHVGVGWN